jgi:hypothetical protein
MNIATVEQTVQYAQELVQLLNKESFGARLEPRGMVGQARTITFTRKIQQHRILIGPADSEGKQWRINVERQLSDGLWHVDLTLVVDSHLVSNASYFIVGGLLYW